MNGPAGHLSGWDALIGELGTLVLLPVLHLSALHLEL